MRSETIKNDIKIMLSQLTDMVKDREGINVKSIVSSIHTEIDKYNTIDAFVIREYLKDSLNAISASKQTKPVVASANLQQVTSPDGSIHVVDMDTKNIVYTTKLKDAADEFMESYTGQPGNPSATQATQPNPAPIQGAPEVVGPEDDDENDDNTKPEVAPQDNGGADVDVPDPLDGANDQPENMDLDEPMSKEDNYDLQNIKDSIQKSTDLLSMIENAIDTVSDLDSITELVTIKVAVEDKIDRLNSLTPEDPKVSEILDSLNVLMTEVESKAIDIVNKSTPGVDKESITPAQEIKDDVDKLETSAKTDKQPIEQDDLEHVEESVEVDKNNEALIGDNKEDIKTDDMDDPNDPYADAFHDDTEINTEPSADVPPVETTTSDEPLATDETNIDNIDADDSLAGQDDMGTLSTDSDTNTMQESIDQLQSMISELDSLIQDVSAIAQPAAPSADDIDISTDEMDTDLDTGDINGGSDELANDSIDPDASTSMKTGVDPVELSDGEDVSADDPDSLIDDDVDTTAIDKEKSPINSSELIPSNNGVLEIGRDTIKPETTATLPLEGENPLQADVLIPCDDGVLEVGRDTVKPGTTATLPETGKNPLQATLISQEWVTDVLNKNSLVFKSVKRKGPYEYVINTGNKGVMSSIEWKKYTKEVMRVLVKAGWNPDSELAITLK